MASRIYASEHYSYGKFPDLSKGVSPESTGGIQRQEWKWENGGLYTRFVQICGEYKFATKWEGVGRVVTYEEIEFWQEIKKSRICLNK